MAWAQPAYRLLDITPPGATASRELQIDPTGTYVVGIASLPTGDRVFLWTGGTSTYLAIGPGTVRFDSGVFVNASGQVVGIASEAGALAAYRWTVSEQTPLQKLYTGSYSGQFGELSTMAWAINASGVAVGSSSATPTSSRAVLWPAGSTSVTAISELYVDAAARSLNDAGDIVGVSQVYPCPSNPAGNFPCYRATRWSNGATAIFEPAAGYTSSSARDINDAGHIVGLAYSGNTRYAAMLWRNGTATRLQPLNTRDYMLAVGLNASDQVVGYYLSGTGARRAFLWQGGTTYDLTGLLDASGAGRVIQEATSISDDGTIAAYACRTTGGTGCTGVLLVPTAPAPPVPAYTRYLAEGATGAFFDTRIALLNPGHTNASAILHYQPASGSPVTQGVAVPARSRVTIDPEQVPGLASAEFSTVVHASQELVVDRTMNWDGTGYGSHSETAVTAPATTWYLAEGATIGGFSLFYLLQNPAPTQTTVVVRYLRTSGPPLVKSYVLPPQSRTNIWVNVEDFPGLGQALASAEFSAVIESQDATPIIVERAMYRDSGGRLFDAGHESTGVTTPATDWFLAEGATGPFFDMFVLIANPTGTDADVTVTYLTIDGTTYSRTLVARANSRSGIWVDQEQFPGIPGLPLADAAVSTTVRSTNGVPLVVERAMWWPGDSTSWHEAHNAAGATATGTRWAVAEGEVGGARGHETYLLIANTSAFAGSATVTLLFEDGTAASRSYALPPSSRTNVAVGPHFSAAAGRRFGAVIESTGTTPAQIVVERAMYSGSFTAGTSALATRLQ